MEQVDVNGQTRTLIHYVFQTDPERVACMPNMREFHQTVYHPNYQRSGDIHAVTCPACRATKVYREGPGVAGANLPAAAVAFPENQEGRG